MTRIASAAAAIAIALLGGVAGGFLVSRSTASAVKSPRPEAGPVAVVDPMEVEDLDRRVAALESLAARQQAATRLSAYAARSGAQRRSDRMGAAGAESSSSSGAAAVDSPVFEAAVRDVVDRVQGEREQEREQQRQQRRDAAVGAWSEELGTKLALTDAQRQKVRDLALAFHDEVREMWTRGADAGAAPSWQNRRESAQSLRESYEAKLGELLDGRQMREYEALGDEYRLGMGMRSRGPRGGQAR